MSISQSLYIPELTLLYSSMSLISIQAMKLKTEVHCLLTKNIILTSLKDIGLFLSLTIP